MDTPQYTIAPLLSEHALDEIVAGLAKTIARDFAGQEILLVGVLDGAFVFLHHLAQALLLAGMQDMIIDFVGLDTYGSGMVSSGEPKITKDLKRDIQGKIVVLVEDIVDTGFSLSILQAMLSARRPQRLVTVALLSKDARRKIPVPVEYIGKHIPDEFVIGYGLDYDGRHRELPYIGVVQFS